MRPVVVVAVLPVGGHAADFVQAGEDVAIEYLGSQGSVESLDVGVLGGLSRLDVDELDAALSGPLLQELANQLRSVVQAQSLRCPANLDQFVQRPDHSKGRQAGVDLDTQGLPVEIVDDVEGPEAPAGPQGIGHEVGGPGLVRAHRHFQRVADSLWQPALAPTWQVEPQLAVIRAGLSISARLILMARVSKK